MIVIQNTSVMNIENALRGARNPLSSWKKSDSYHDDAGQYQLGKQDLALAQRLRDAGSDHRKFMRQIFVSVDITAPLYFWKEFDTYKVSTVSNSTSTMHTIHKQPFTIDDFSTDHMTPGTLRPMNYLIAHLEILRQKFLETKEKKYWYDIIQLLPSSYHQLRTCTLNYENLIQMYTSRQHHKLEEWHEFCHWITTLPYGKSLIVREG